jgi:predicted nucleotidyltransferase
MIGCKSFSNFDANDADDDDDENNILNESSKLKNNRSILSSKRYSSSCNQILKSLSVKHDEVFESNESNLVSFIKLYLYFV